MPKAGREWEPQGLPRHLSGEDSATIHPESRAHTESKAPPKALEYVGLVDDRALHTPRHQDRYISSLWLADHPIGVTTVAGLSPRIGLE